MPLANEIYVGASPRLWMYLGRVMFSGESASSNSALVRYPFSSRALSESPSRAFSCLNGPPDSVAFNVLPPPRCQNRAYLTRSVLGLQEGPFYDSPPRTHSQYLECFQTSRAHLGLKIPDDETHLWCKSRRLNVSAAHPILARLYDPHQGCPARPPEDMLRAWLLMLEWHITSVEVWVKHLREKPLPALMSGLAPDDVPDVGTCYDFQDRLLRVHKPVLDQVCLPRRRSEQRKKDAALRDKNNLAPHVGILDQLADRLMARPATSVLYGQWQTNLATCPDISVFSHKCSTPFLCPARSPEDGLT
jgi:hypothetical protein